MVQPARRMPSAAAARASPLVRDGLAYPNSEPQLFKNGGGLLHVGVADDEAGVCLFGRPGRLEAGVAVEVAQRQNTQPATPERRGVVYEIGPRLRPADLDHPDLEQRSPLKTGELCSQQVHATFVRG